MAATEGQNLDQVLEDIERREQTARKRAIFFTIIPIVIAAILIWYTSNRINYYLDQTNKLKKTNQELAENLARTEKKLKEIALQLMGTEAILKDATDFQKFIHPIDFVDMKHISSRYPNQARALKLILDLRGQNVSWYLGGVSPNVGFDSPTFALYILSELNLPGRKITPGPSLLKTSRKLFEILPQASQPEVGDLTFYPSGYVMFYFQDKNNRPFVIGMTPFGILALDPEYAKPTGYRRISYF